MSKTFSNGLNVTGVVLMATSCLHLSLDQTHLVDYLSGRSENSKIRFCSTLTIHICITAG